MDGGKDPFSLGKVATVRAAAAGAPNENSPHVASLGRRAGADGRGVSNKIFESKRDDKILAAREKPGSPCCLFIQGFSSV